jgi:dTDP-4-amino-4,6-dideoxygalactose transaminase
MLKKAAEHRHAPLNIPGYTVKNWPGIQEGDEVLTSALTCTATNWPILANNYRIKWVDVDENTLNMDLDDLARKITPTTKVIYLVHWGGYPLDLDRVKAIQEKAYSMYGFKPAVIEDCAHSFGSTYKNKPIGTHGNICTFSFQAIKHVTSVDGGALFVPHEELYKRGKLLRWYGIDRESNRKDFRCEADVVEWGFKFHMNDVSAAVGIENLKHADEIVGKHKDNAAYYNEALKGVSGVTLLENKDDRESAYWLYTIKVKDRDKFTEHMAKHGIAVSRVHERNDLHTTVREYITALPALDKVVKEMICIPVGWWVTEEDREYIVETIKSGWNEN